MDRLTQARGPRRGRPYVHLEGSAVNSADDARLPGPLPSDPPAPPRLSLIRGEGAGARQLPLPFEYEVRPGVPAVPPAPPHLHLVGDAHPEISPDLPPPGVWTMRLARAIDEVAHGERPASQLAPHLTREQLTKLSIRGQALARHPSQRAQRGSARLRTVTGVRVCPVAPGVVEASAVLTGGQRARAIALRLEAVGSQWVATVVDLG